MYFLENRKQSFGLTIPHDYVKKCNIKSLVHVNSYRLIVSVLMYDWWLKKIKNKGNSVCVFRPDGLSESHIRQGSGGTVHTVEVLGGVWGFQSLSERQADRRRDSRREKETLAFNWLLKWQGGGCLSEANDGVVSAGFSLCVGTPLSLGNSTICFLI